MPIGVYLIEINGKRYVGSSAKGIEERWRGHLRQLKRGTHNNRHLQNAFNKYGEGAFRFSILKEVETPEECISLEQKYIDELRPEYNIYPTAGSPLGVKFSDEHKAKLGAAHLGIKRPEWLRQKLSADRSGEGHPNWGKHHSEATIAKMKKAPGHAATRGAQHCKSRRVVQLTLEGDVVKEYGATILAAEAVGVSDTSIGYCCQGKTKTSGGFAWAYAELAEKAIWEIKQTGLYAGNRKTRVLQLTLDGNPIKEHASMKQAAEAVGAYTQNICLCCQGKIKTSAGFKWQYA